MSNGVERSNKMDVELDNIEVTSDLNKITFISAIEAEARSKQIEE